MPNLIDLSSSNLKLENCLNGAIGNLPNLSPTCKPGLNKFWLYIPNWSIMVGFLKKFIEFNLEKEYLFSKKLGTSKIFVLLFPMFFFI
jgi:hypothetical protein